MFVKGLLITTQHTLYGIRYESILLPTGVLITGHSCCINFLRHYSTNNSTTGTTTTNTANTVLPKNVSSFSDPNYIREHHLEDVIIGVLLGDYHAEKMGYHYHLKFEQGSSYGHETYLNHLYAIFKDYVNPNTPPHKKTRNTT